VRGTFRHAPQVAQHYPTLEYIHLQKVPVAAGCFFAAFARYAAAGPCGRLGQSEAQNQPVLTLVDCHPYGVSAKPCPRALSRPLSSCGQLMLHGMARHFVISLLLFPTEGQKRGGEGQFGLGSLRLQCALLPSAIHAAQANISTLFLRILFYPNIPSFVCSSSHELLRSGQRS
jgi:hypothetical protein